MAEVKKRQYVIGLAMGEREEEEMTKAVSETIQEMRNGRTVRFRHLPEGTEEPFLLTGEEPDVVMLSISEDSVRRLEWVKELRKRNPAMPVCICSSVHSYDLVSAVVDCEAAAYIAIPVRKAQLHKQLNAVFEKVEYQREKKQKLEACAAWKNNIEWMLDKGFLDTILENSGRQKGVEDYCRKMHLAEQGYILSIRYDKNNQWMETAEEQQQVMASIKNRIKAYANCAIALKGRNRILVYIEETKTKSLPETEKQYVSVIENFFEEQLGMSVDVKMGELCSVNTIYQSYQQTMEKWRCGGEEPEETGIRRDRYSLLQEYGVLSNQLLESVKFRKDDAEEIFSKLLRLIAPLSNEEQINKMIQIIVMCCHVAYLEDYDKMRYLDVFLLVEEAKGEENIQRWAYEKFEQFMQTLYEYQDRKTSNTVKMALAYIEKRYNTDISLEDVAKQVGVSPQHFSKIFKKETGANYVDWLTQLRIEQAKNYLLMGKYTIKEVCYLVGYKDPNYFSRLFRKIVGMPPRDYISKYR